MPLVSRKIIGGSELLLWRISESEEELCALVTESDRESTFRFASPRRRIEHLAWRAALRVRIPRGDVGYTPAGSPFVCGQALHFGAAHTDGMAVVIVSGSACAVDVERLDRDLTKVASKFISPHESQFADAVRPDFPAAVWCAKEAMYKYSGRRELDFVLDLKITRCNLPAGEITGEITDEVTGGITGRTIHASVERFEEFLIVYICN